MGHLTKSLHDTYGRIRETKVTVKMIGRVMATKETNKNLFKLPIFDRNELGTKGED